jgi:RNA polymerase subunit RPABC4/transcription elongation factor Spt4
MTLIKCPQCGQTASYVASTCPHCSHLLTQNPLQQGEAAGLSKCRNCTKLIDRDSTVCPYCGYHPQRWRMAQTVTWAVVGLAALTVLVVFALRVLFSQGEPPLASVSEPTPPPQTVEMPVVPPTAPPVVAPAPDTAVTLVPENPPTTSGPRQVRWATDWVNVRLGPGMNAPIVGALRPGLRVEVEEFENGWWSVYVDGSYVGYAASSLLSRDPPSVPETTRQ